MAKVTVYKGEKEFDEAKAEKGVSKILGKVKKGSGLFAWCEFINKVEFIHIFACMSLLAFISFPPSI